MKRLIATFFILIPLIILAGDFDSQYFYKQFDDYSIAPDDLMLMKHNFVVKQLMQINKQNPEVKIEKIGHSVQGRSINKVSFGRGDTKLLLWSQMHGDEPTATAALLAIFNYFSKNFSDSRVQHLYNNLTIIALPMLNPDGAELFQRRNAQDIDINRDARLLQSPEARLLKHMQEETKPHYGYNLHDMRGREMVGETKQLLNIAFMAPPFDKNNSDNQTRTLAKQLVVKMQEALNPFIAGHMARYKADYMPRAFGDAMQNWGVSTVLIESGLHQDSDVTYLVRLNFIALLSSFHAIASGLIEQADEKMYDQLPLEGRQLFDLLIKDVLLYNGTNIPPFRTDIGININRRLEDNKLIESGKIEDLGDLSITDGIQVIEGEDLVALPGFIVKSSAPVSEDTLIQNGITTLVVDKIPDEKLKKYIWQTSPENLEDTPERPRSNKIITSNIARYTSKSAETLGIKDRGIIRRNKKADILIFCENNHQKIHFDQLRYVLKNGKIIFPLKRGCCSLGECSKISPSNSDIILIFGRNDRL